MWNLRQYLTQVDIDHQGAAPLKAALLTVIMSPNYVKVDEVRVDLLCKVILYYVKVDEVRIHLLCKVILYYVKVDEVRV